MFINEKLTGSVPIDIKFPNNNNYLQEKKKELEVRFKEEIERYGSSPGFFIQVTQQKKEA